MKVPSYRLHKATGLAVVTLSGHDFYLGRHGSEASQEEYRRLIARWLASGRQAPTAIAADLTVSEVLASYWSHAESYYKKDGEPTSQLDRVKRSIAPARELYGSTRARDFGPAALKAVRAWMVAKGWSRKVVNQRVGCLKRAWKWAVGEELVPASSHHALSAVEGLRAGRSEAPERPRVVPAPEEAIAAALGQLGEVLAQAVRFQLLTGCRPGEALGLRPEHLDRSRPVWRWRPPTHKMQHRKRERVILVGPQAQELITPYLFSEYVFSPQLSMRLFRARQRAARKSRVQPSQENRSKAKPKRQPGARYSTDSYGQAVLKACEKADCAHWHPNQLRHNAATRLVEQFGWEVARIILGHATLDATRIYGEDALAKAERAVLEAG